MKEDIKSNSKRNRREFLLKFFEDVPSNANLEMNGFILFKHWDGNIKEWTVDIFSQESWSNMQSHHITSSIPQEETLF